MKRSIPRAIAWTVAILGPATIASAQFSQPAQTSSPPAGSEQPAAQPKQDVIALVNGEAITKPEFQSALATQMKQANQGNQGNQADPNAAKQIRQQVLNSLIESRLVEQYMINKGPDVQDQEVQSAINQYKQQVQSRGISFEQSLQARGYTESSLTKRVQGSLAWQKYQQQQLTDEKLQQHFAKNPDQFPSDDFQTAKPYVAQSYVGQLWSEIVDEAKPNAKIQIVESGQSKQAPAPNGGGIPAVPQ